MRDSYYTRQLRRFNFRYDTQTIDTDYGSTHLLARGQRNAQPIVLLHGRSLNATLWRDYLATFSNRYRVIAIDILGEVGKRAAASLHLGGWLRALDGAGL